MLRGEKLKRSKFKINTPNGPLILCGLGFIGVVLELFTQNFGTFPHYGSGPFANPELTGVIFPVFALIIPLFFKKFRKNFWTKRNIAVITITLAVNIILIIVLYANKYYYWSYWVFEHWNRNNCPPIRWDIWNIL